tara:strand:- start:497 stop:1192 length:696 start_codon:yes stop_codon:yes gene_type:complete
MVLKKKDIFIILKKFNKEFTNILKNANETMICRNLKCKNQLMEFNKVRELFNKKNMILLNNRNKIKDKHKLNKDLQYLLKEYNNNKDVLEYRKEFNDKKIYSKINKKIKQKFEIVSKKYYIDTGKIYNEIFKDKEYKKYSKQISKLGDDLNNIKESMSLKKCSFTECLHLHKQGTELVKDFTKKICKEYKINNSCNIYKKINKLNMSKITFKEYETLVNLVKKKGMFGNKL